MSKRKQKQAQASEAQRWLLKKRRIALGLYLLFLAAAIVGSQGPWWQVVVGENAVEATYGSDVDRYRWVPTDDPANPTAREEVLLRPAVIAVLLCIFAFFFASYDLVADADIQVPVLLASVGLCALSGKVFYDLYYDQQVIQETVQEVEARRLKGELDAPDGAALPKKPRPEFRLRFLWGLALLMSSSLVMLIDSVYMTFFAQRTIAEPT